MSVIKKTSLNQFHREHSAKLVEFSGYELPVQYRSIREEHCHTREKASLFDISHMGQIRLSATDVSTITHNIEQLIPNSISNLRDGHQRYSVLLNQQAGIVDDFMISRYKNDYILVVNAACKDKDFSYLSEQLDSSIKIEMLQNRSLIAVQGPGSVFAMERLNKNITRLSFMQCGEFELESIPCLISRSGYTGEDGFEISIPSDHVISITNSLLEHPDLLPAGLGARDTLRLEAGLCLYGHELNETTTPIEAGLDWVVSKQKIKASNPYLGKDVIQEQLEQGIDTRRIGLTVNAKVPVREGCPLMDLEKNIIGHVSSGSFSPSLNKPIAMGYVDKEFSQNNTSLFAEVRNKTVPVSVCSLPFIPHQYHR